MSMQLRKAIRSQAFLKLGIAGPSGSGKTLGALLMAYGMLKEKYKDLSDDEIWDKVAIIDTENSSGQLYAGREVYGKTIGQYNAITLSAPFEPERYVSAITLCEESGMEVCIIDSLSHAWIGVGGALDIQGAASKRSGNSYTAWRDVTPRHNRLVDAVLQTKMHVICTLRSKTEYIITESNGKKGVQKMGLSPQFRDGMEYEFTMFLEIDSEHTSFGAKDRTGIVDGSSFTIDINTGKKIMNWLQEARSVEDGEIVSSKAEVKEVDVDSIKREIIKICTSNGGSTNKELMNILLAAEPTKGNPNLINDPIKISSLLNELKETYK